MKKKIAIVGAGIAGLTLANFIKKDSNFEFMIYEKNENLSLDGGYGIQLAPNSVSILNQIGFKKINTENIFQPKALNFYSINNNKICDLNLTQFNSDNINYTTLLRSTLLEFLKDEIYTQHIRFGKNIKRISEIKDKVLLNFDDNTNDLVDYVIAADGIFSHTRSFFENNINKPKFQNSISIRSIIKSTNKLIIDKKNINLFMGSNAHVVIYPINKRNELNLVCIIREKKYDPINIKTIIEKKLLCQNQNLKELFQGKLNSWPLYASQKIIRSTNKKIFYLGDAFYGFLPTMAQGASQSIEGALELYNLLKENTHDAHSIYFEKRLKKTELIKKRSNFNFFIFHIKNSIIKVIRNKVLKLLVNNKNFVKSYIGEVYKN